MNIKKSNALKAIDAITQGTLVYPFEAALIADESFKSAEASAKKDFQKLSEVLNEENRQILLQYERAKEDITYAYGRASYTQGFRDATNLTMDLLSSETE